ncbi:helix-turn-helix transcriptional regulator [Bradyrhizobium sp. SSUT77]|uniref:helix-turn-helix transcriptional regulator n=1 Tax=Bradyrhizobium sp. SSUT77 TaxID=3040603 RepID=UPI0032674102
MIQQTASTQLRELGDFVRFMRERLEPTDIGLPLTVRRRTPGLRREEVAQLSGVSVTWYTWLEQGRETLCASARAPRDGAATRPCRTGLSL